MATTGKRDPVFSFRWPEGEREDFSRAVSRLEADGKIDPNTSDAEAIRSVLKEWTEDPSASAFER